MIDKNNNQESILYGASADLMQEARIENESHILIAEMNEMVGQGQIRPTSTIVARTKTVINAMIFLLLKYSRDVKKFDELAGEIEENKNDLESIHQILTEAQREFAKDAGAVAGFRMKTTKKPPWASFLQTASK